MSLNLLEKMFADKVDLESRNIIAQFIFMNGKELHIKHAYNKQPGAFKKFWNDFIIPFCKDNGIEIISLVDSACTPHDSDIWGSYGFSGRYHSGTRYYYVNSEDYIEKMKVTPNQFNTVIEYLFPILQNNDNNSTIYMILKHYGFDTNTSIQFFKNEEAKKKFFDVKDYIGSNQVKNQFRNAQPIGNY